MRRRSWKRRGLLTTTPATVFKGGFGEPERTDASVVLLVGAGGGKARLTCGLGLGNAVLPLKPRGSLGRSTVRTDLVHRDQLRTTGYRTVAIAKTILAHECRGVPHHNAGQPLVDGVATPGDPRVGHVIAVGVAKLDRCVGLLVLEPCSETGSLCGAPCS